MSIAAAEVARPVRFVNIALGVALIAAPFVYGASPTQAGLTVGAGVLIAALSVRRGTVGASDGGWSRWIA